MSVNDILVQGAKSLFFLDYYACGKLDVDVAERVVKGVAKGCELAGCALIGGETAEMPGMYPEGEYDLAGFAVGVVEKDEIIDGTTIKPGDVVLGLASSGPHSNGFSLLRKVVEVAGADWSMPFDGATLADRAMEPTRIYVKQVLSVMKKVQIKGMAHITGGGLIENVPRVLPEGVQCCIDGSSWTRPAIFEWLEEKVRLTVTRCTASSITASVSSSSFPLKTLTALWKPSKPKVKRHSASVKSRRFRRAKPLRRALIGRTSERHAFQKALRPLQSERFCLMSGQPAGTSGCASFRSVSKASGAKGSILITSGIERSHVSWRLAS